MQLETRVAIRCRWALALLFVGPALAVADSKSTLPIELDAIAFKENGRFDEKIIAECSVDEELREAVTKLNPIRRRERSRQTSSTGFESRHMTLRIDKVARFGTGRAGGTEIGVTAIPAGQSTGPLFLCRDESIISRPSHCERVTYCAKKIANDVTTWAKKQPSPTDEARSSR